MTNTPSRVRMLSSTEREAIRAGLLLLAAYDSVTVELKALANDLYAVLDGSDVDVILPPKEVRK